MSKKKFKFSLDLISPPHSKIGHFYADDEEGLREFLLKKNITSEYDIVKTKEGHLRFLYNDLDRTMIRCVYRWFSKNKKEKL